MSCSRTRRSGRSSPSWLSRTTYSMPRRLADSCASLRRRMASWPPPSDMCPASPLVTATKRTLCPSAAHLAATPAARMSQSSGCAPMAMIRSGVCASALGGTIVVTRVSKAVTSTRIGGLRGRTAILLPACCYAATGGAGMPRIALGVACVMAMVTGMTAQQPRPRQTTPDEFKWNLTELFPSDAAWQTEKTRLSGEFAKAREFNGTLSQSAARLQQALDLQSAQDKAFHRLAVYATHT